MAYETVTKNISDYVLGRGASSGFAGYNMGSVGQGYTVTRMQVVGAIIFNTEVVDVTATPSGPGVIAGIQITPFNGTPQNPATNPDSGNWRLLEQIPAFNTYVSDFLTPPPSGSSVYEATAINVNMKWAGQFLCPVAISVFFSTGTPAGSTAQFTWYGESRITYS